MTESLDHVQALLGPLGPALVATGLESVERVTIVPGRSIEVTLRREGPLRLDAPAAEQVLADLTGRFPPQTDSVDIDGSPHRLVFLRGPGGKVAGAVIRFVRPTSGTAEPLRTLLEAGKHLLVLGAAGQAKTDLLRDIGRILAEPPHRTVAVVDLFGELGGSALSPLAALGRALRLYATSHDEQVRILSRLVADIAPSAVVVGRASSPREVDALRILALEGVQVVAALPCRRIMQCVAWAACYPVLGLQASVGGSGAPAVRITVPVIDVVVELLPLGVIGIYHDAPEALDCALSGRAPKAELREISSRTSLDISLT
jgi:hypothetical protein